MGNLCTKKRKGSDSSEKSEGSHKKDSGEGLENHSNESKRPSQNGQGTAQQAAPAETAETSKKSDPAKTRVQRDFEPSSVSGDSVSSPTTMPADDSSLHPLTLPDEMKKQSDNVKHLLTGRVQRVKPSAKCRKITLYVCASDSQDFRLEKGNLHTQIYPKLREYASNLGYELHITDLHWKSELEERQDHEFPELCIRELKRQLEVSYVVPVLFLSNALGASLLPKTVEQQDFELALKNVTDSENSSLLENWYSLDPHAQPPCYRLKPISSQINKIQSSNPEERKEGLTEWHEIVEKILSIFLNVFPNELRDTYLTTVIEQEIHNSIFMSREVGKRSTWICRVFTHLQSSVSSESTTVSPIETEKHRRLESLQNEIKLQLVAGHILRRLVKWHEGGLSTNHSEHLQYLEDLNIQLTKQLQNIIDEIIEEDKTKAQPRSCYGIEGSLCTEVMQHTMFCQQAAKCSPSTENPINAVKSYIGSDKNTPLIVHGPKGCGKTSFLARVIQQVSSWYPDVFLIFRFVGISSDSTSLLKVFHTITSQVSVLIHGKNYWIPYNWKCYQSELYKMVSPVSPVVIIIDGLDELSVSPPIDLSWLSEELPAKMKLIVSCSDDSTTFQSLKSIIDQETSYVTIPPLSSSAGENLLTTSILQYSHSVDTDVQNKLSARLKSCTHPLFIKVLGWQATIESLDVSELNDVNSAIAGLFDQLEKDLGKEQVTEVLSLLCTSRFGLCDSELLDLLSSFPLFCSKETYVGWAPASIFLAQFFQRLGPFLEWGLNEDAVVTRWRDSTLFEIAQKRYVGTKAAEKKARQVLLKYFQEGRKDEKNGRYMSLNEKVGNRHFKRKLEELPYQSYYVNGSLKKDYLYKIDWLEKKIQTSSIYNIIEDIWLEQQKDSDNKDIELLFLRQIFELSASALHNNGQQFYGQMYDRLQQFFHSNQESSSKWANKFPFVKSLYEASITPKLPSFLPLIPTTSASSAGSITTPDDIQNLILPNSLNGQKSYYELENSKTTNFNELTRLKEGNQFVVSLATDQEQVCVWDVYQQSPIRTLNGVHNPNAFKIINDKRFVILCGRELHIYDLDEVAFVTKLKGVMNQKMPYFGIQDEDHVVCLSRNRMYVNLINLTSGDLESSFKVGEDRFLNSLIISENGKVCVCGDETQKPFPLLVWDLTSRKLVYDLRIPHHEFVTALSAITKEGHFVCCVCQELDDPGPNFIVVYDLQSGTLFKKWKPGCNTHALAISGQGSCVINALEDNRILVWDLVTGACQWTLDKHTAPVDVLKLDQKGSRCLSCDSNGRDRNICLWDITTGQLLALFTTDVPFTACEVFNNGEGVVLGLRGKSEIVTLLYRHNESIESKKPSEKFGSDQNQGKVTNMKAT